MAVQLPVGGGGISAGLFAGEGGGSFLPESSGGFNSHGGFMDSFNFDDAQAILAGLQGDPSKAPGAPQPLRPVGSNVMTGREVLPVNLPTTNPVSLNRRT